MTWWLPEPYKDYPGMAFYFQIKQFSRKHIFARTVLNHVRSWNLHNLEASEILNLVENSLTSTCCPSSPIRQRQTLLYTQHVFVFMSSGTFGTSIKKYRIG